MIHISGKLVLTEISAVKNSHDPTVFGEISQKDACISGDKVVDLDRLQK